jgi:hypothetical protein
LRPEPGHPPFAGPWPERAHRANDVTNRKRKHTIETIAVAWWPELLLRGSLFGVHRSVFGLAPVTDFALRATRRARMSFLSCNENNRLLQDSRAGAKTGCRMVARRQGEAIEAGSRRGVRKTKGIDPGTSSTQQHQCSAPRGRRYHSRALTRARQRLNHAHDECHRFDAGGSNGPDRSTPESVIHLPPRPSMPPPKQAGRHGKAHPQSDGRCE